MKNDLLRLFIDELEDIYDSELRIVDILPKLIDLASSPDLKKALSEHFKETQDQVDRVERIFAMLDLPATKNECEAMKGLLKEAEELISSRTKSSLMDVVIISAAQKVEHYEIATYGTLRSFAKQLELDSDIIDLIQNTLDEESAADKKLTKIAEGTFFSIGINKVAAEDSLL